MNCLPLRTLGPALLALLAPCCSRSEVKEKRPPNVVLICIDATRADHVGTYGYGRATTPVLDELAARAVVFTHASATAGWTKPSVPSLLTGTYPMQHGVYEGGARDTGGLITDLLPPNALTLAEVFQQAGYRTGAFLHSPHLRAGNGLEQGFERYEEESMDARQIRWRGLDWIDATGGASGKPFFLYLHFLDVHWPYPTPEEWLTRFATAAATARFRGTESRSLYDSVNSGERTLSAEDRTALEALYDGALAYVDSELGRFLAGLELRDLSANTIVCVVSDHGEEFGEHGHVGHGHGLWEGLLHVPWILSVPGSSARRVASQVSLVDLFPTLATAAGLATIPPTEGVNRLTEVETERPILAEHKSPDQYLQSLRLGEKKLVRSFEPPPEAGAHAPQIQLGTRWEARFTLVGDERVATQLQPFVEPPEQLSDSLPEPLPELSGRISGLTQVEFRIADLVVRYDEKSASTAELANGQAVQVRGQLAEGVLAAERIQPCAPQPGDEVVFRATVEKLEPMAAGALLTLGGLTLKVTRETVVKGIELPPKKRRLGRAQLAALLDSGANSFADSKQYSTQRRMYDLAQDPGELAALSATAQSPLDKQLDELGLALAKKRCFGSQDQKVLDAAALRALQAIGYGGN